MRKFKIKFQNLLLALVLIISCFGGIVNVNAASTAKVGFSGNSSVSVGSNITVNLMVNSVTPDVSNYNGVVSVSGNLSFDSAYLEFVSATPATSPYGFSMNKNNNYKIAGMDFSGSNGIKTATTIYTFVFKALKIGTTQVTFTNAKLTDSSFQYTTNVTPKIITINTPSSTKPTNPTNPTEPTDPVVTRSSDATLKKLDASGYTLSPAFSKDVTSYVVEVPKSATTVKLTGEKNDSKASVSGLGDITLTGDETTANVVVTAEDGTKKTYTVVIKKKADIPVDVPVAKDATLKKLDVSGFTLTPTFKPSVTSYSMQVKNNITALKVTAIPNDESSKVTITGNSNWKEGVNTITIKVEATDGTTKVYLVNVTRNPKKETNTTGKAKSSDNKLTNLIIGSPHEMSPKFSSDVDAYDIVVPYEVDKLDLTPVLSSSKATYKITGNSDFKVGQGNVVAIEITAEDGSKRIVLLNVRRNTDSSETDLNDIIIDGYDIDPKFDPKKTDYTIDVPSDVDKLNIKATSKFPNSKIEIVGNENLKEGENTVLIKVTDKNGYVKYYQIKVNKAVKEKKIFGLTYLQFAIIGFIFGLLLLLLLILLLLLRRKKDDRYPINPQQTPIIDFKPEFNFGSRNGTDDDIVYSGATLNQSSNNEREYKEEKKRSVNYEEAKELPYVDKDDSEELPYDMYDDVVTKDELIDAIYEGLEEKNPEKLQMLLEQEKLNRRKEAMRKREERNRERD